MYALKSIARRGTSLGAAFALAIGAILPVVLPAASAYADDLNPLTERSLTLSSSSPGWSYTDGSGNSTYAPPNSGANGQKTGNYFGFKTSSDADVKTISFQYCKTSAGSCEVPGDDATRGTDTSSTTDLNIHYPATQTDNEIGSSDFSTVIDSSTGKVKAVPGYTDNNPKYQADGGTGDAAEAAKDVTGSYVVMYKDGSTWTQSTGWTVAANNVADAGGTTNNYITLVNSTGQHFDAAQQVQVLFFANGSYYITNPGSGYFFVKINTYGVAYDDGTTVDFSDLQPATDTNVIDGGVTVANVMNQSIQITTKVLETMQFSVGTVDPDTLTDAELGQADGGSAGAPVAHTPCDTIKTAMVKGDPQNVLPLGDQDAESSLETDHAYATHSYWRLSSNSSAGATVYYSGHTLSNTSGDEIQPIGTTAKHSAIGSEQFGLAIATTPLTGAAYNTATYGVNYAQDRATDKDWENGADNDKTTVDGSVITDLTSDSTLNGSYHTPRLDPLTPEPNYGGGSGTINGVDSLGSLGTNNELGANDTSAAFAFDKMSDTIPAPIATEATQVVDCVTAKMRYIGNIAATTPAGIYTTKINYIAAPQY